VIRTVVLTLLLLALGALFATPLVWQLLHDPDAQRRAIQWGIPVAALLWSFLLAPRLSWPPGEAASPPGGRIELLGACAAAFLVDQSFLGLARLTDWATFTFGAQELAETELALAAAWGLPAALALGIWGWERALRGAVYTGWRRWLPQPAALGLSVAVGTALSLPAVLPGGEVRDPAFVAASLVAILCREVSFGLLFTRGGGLLVAGLYRGAFYFAETFVINDWYSVYFPAFNYVAGGTTLYVVRAITAILALVLIAVVTRRRGGDEEAAA
jgi:hypothetical protein